MVDIFKELSGYFKPAQTQPRVELSVTYEKAISNPYEGITETQVIDISTEVRNREEAEELGYYDFRADLYINGKHIADISHVLGKMPGYQELIDATDWVELYMDKVAGNE